MSAGQGFFRVRPVGEAVVLGPDSLIDRSRTRRLSRDRRTLPPEAFGSVRKCELCDSEADTGVRYGLSVCESCDEELLP